MRAPGGKPPAVVKFPRRLRASPIPLTVIPPQPAPPELPGVGARHWRHRPPEAVAGTDAFARPVQPQTQVPPGAKPSRPGGLWVSVAVLAAVLALPVLVVLALVALFTADAEGAGVAGGGSFLLWALLLYCWADRGHRGH